MQGADDPEQSKGHHQNLPVSSYVKGSATSSSEMSASSQMQLSRGLSPRLHRNKLILEVSEVAGRSRELLMTEPPVPLTSLDFSFW